MLIPNLKIEEMFKFVRNKVSEISISQYGEEQLSWEYSSLVGDFYFSVTPQPVNEQVTDEKYMNSYVLVENLMRMLRIIFMILNVCHI